MKRIALLTIILISLSGCTAWRGVANIWDDDGKRFEGVVCDATKAIVSQVGEGSSSQLHTGHYFRMVELSALESAKAGGLGINEACQRMGRTVVILAGDDGLVRKSQDLLPGQRVIVLGSLVPKTTGYTDSVKATSINPGRL